MCNVFNLHKTNKNFTTDVKSCSTEKNINVIKFNKQSMDLKKTQVTEKNLVKSPSGYKFLRSKYVFYNFSIKFILECVKTEKNVGKIQELDNQVSSSSKSVGKFL